MSKNILNISWKKKRNLINYFNEDFLNSKDEALQPITLFFENIDILDVPQDKINYFPLHKKEKEKEKKSDNSKKSQNFQNSQRSTSNSNKKSEKRKSITDSQIYSSNIVIVHNDEENEDLSPTDPIEKEVEKLKRLMSRNREKKKRRANKSHKSNSNIKTMKFNY